MRKSLLSLCTLGLALCCAYVAQAQTWPPTIPSGFPTPIAIPTPPALTNPHTIQPGAVFGGYTVAGDGVTDDTNAIQAALNASDVNVAAHTYAISGTISIPTHRNINCSAGATFLDTQSSSTQMFRIGFGSGSLGSNSMVGCTLQGTDTATDYSTYQGGNGGYSELFEITSGWGLHTSGVLLQGNTFLDAQGDSLLVYSPCGTNNTGAPCNNGTPGTEGPDHIFVYNNTFSHCVQPGIHFNGGQNIEAARNTLTDCNYGDEVDSNVLQVIKSWWFANYLTTVNGTLDSLNGVIYGPSASCSDDNLLPGNDSNCWSFDNAYDGSTTYGATILTEQYDCGGATGGQPGHYANEIFTNGAYAQTHC